MAFSSSAFGPNHWATILAISFGDFENLPHPFSTTYGTFPASCNGNWKLKFSRNYSSQTGVDNSRKHENRINNKKKAQSTQLFMDRQDWSSLQFSLYSRYSKIKRKSTMKAASVTNTMLESHQRKTEIILVLKTNSSSGTQHPHPHLLGNWIHICEGARDQCQTDLHEMNHWHGDYMAMPHSTWKYGPTMKLDFLPHFLFVFGKHLHFKDIAPTLIFEEPQGSMKQGPNYQSHILIDIASSKLWRVRSQHRST